MKCPQCHGEMKSGSHVYHVDRNGYHLTFDALPAQVCGQCGEVLFDRETVDRVQEMIQLLDDQASTLLTA